jgi:hypothetical protein
MTSFATTELAQAWNDRKLDMKLTRTKLYSDILYNRLAAEILNSREEIDRKLHECIRTATKPSDLSIPIFAFKARHGLNPAGDLRLWTDGLCKKEGWHWTMQANGDRYPVSHYSVVRNTDLCQRLALLFDGKHFWVSCRPKAELVQGLGASIVREHEIVLHYYPGGLPRNLLNAVLACNRRQIEREAHEPIMPVVYDLEWVEGPGDEPPPALAYPRGPGGLAYRDAPSTPEPGPERECPGAPSHAEDDDGSITVYDTMEEAARDLGRELIEVAGCNCYCCYRPGE